MIRVRGLLFVALCALLVAVAGCSIPPKPMRFNNLMARGNDKLATAGKNFLKAVEPLLRRTGPADVSAARAAVNEADSAVRDLTKEFGGMSAPKFGDSFLSSYREFLKTQRQIVDDCLKPALAALEDNRNYPDAESKRAQVDKLTKKATELEQRAFTSLTQAQKEFCERKEYNFEPKD